MDGGTADTGAIDQGEELLGGETTVFEEGVHAYELAANNLDTERRRYFAEGDHFFNRGWVTAPASTVGGDGLGPTYNSRSCSACHFRDGRAAPPSLPTDPFVGLLLRLSIPGQDVHGGPVGDPNYGGQLQDNSILGVPVEGVPSVTYVEVPGTYADGQPYSLRRPVYTIGTLAFGPMDAAIMVSPRIAPAMIGLGLLEAIPESALPVDDADANNDGISGRTNVVWDVRSQAMRVGRFGWKASQPTVEQQSAGAFLGDIGITSSLFTTENCPAPQTQCTAAPNGGTPELDDLKLSAIALYGRTLAVPARRKWTDPIVRRGEQLFASAKCASCHLPKVTTGASDIPALANQTIRPFTDLLLHDMGPDLADGRPDFRADQQEWRTAPLWGIGLLMVTSRHELMLHDGRARGYAEAILWHGGEAAPSRDAFKAMPITDRDALVAFLRSL